MTIYRLLGLGFLVWLANEVPAAQADTEVEALAIATTAFGVEYRVGRLLVWKLRPFIGAALTTDHSFYGYGGIRLATQWGEHIIVTPSFAVGGYSRGAGKDLGHPPVLGRFGLDVEYRFDNDMRVGAAYHHLSNGKLLGQTNNPGTEIVGLVVSIPIR